MQPVTTTFTTHASRAYGLAIACVVVATLVRLLLQPVLGSNLQFITYFPAVFLTAVFGGFGPTVLAASLSVVLAESLFFMPADGFNFVDPVAFAGMTLFALTGVGMGWLAETRLQALASAQRDTAEARRLEQMAEESAIAAEEAAAQAEEESLRADGEAARAQAALRQAHEAHERTRAVLDSTTDGYIGIDSSWRIIVVNRQAALTFEEHGIDAAQLQGRTLWEIWPAMLGTEVEHRYRQVMSERVPTAFESWYSPHQRWYEGHVYPTADSGIGVFFRDITERKQADLSLREAEETYRALADLSPDAILVKQDRHYVFANQAAARLCGAKSAEDLIGRTPYEFLDAEAQEAARERVRHVFEDHVAASSLQCRWQRLNGSTVEVELAAGPLTWRRKPAVQLVIRDLTERKRIDERLQHTQRMDAIGRLAGGVAHEVNNQMTVVLGAAEFLLKRPDLPALVRSDLDSIRQAAQSSAAVTSQLLSFSRRQLLNPKPLDLNIVMAEIIPVLQRTLGSAIQIEQALKPSLGSVVVDHAQFTQALLNLVLNARDAMPTGGVLRLETSEVDLPAGNELDDGAEAAPGAYVRLRVSDTGMGMDATTVARVFEPFFTTKPVGQGTGLGLSMVHGVVRQSKGYITVESQPGEGTTFALYFPKTTVPSEDASISTPSSDRGGGPRTDGSRLAIVVEDEPAVRGIVVRVLREEGFEVLEAADGTEALALIGQVQTTGRLQLVVTDLAMPLMGGRQLAEQLRAAGHEVPLLFISGYTDEEIERLGLVAAGDDVLRKPFSPTALGDRVRQLAGARTESAGNMKGGRPAGISRVQHPNGCG
jgi:two-component system, cell cycle sensor histidine kinase and response regulator CckA